MAWLPTHPSSAEVKESVELYLYSPSGPSWSVLGQTLSFTLACVKQNEPLWSAANEFSVNTVHGFLTVNLP